MVVMGGKGESGHLRLAFRTREGARVWWWVEKVKTTPPTRFSSEGGGKGVVVGGKGQNGPLRLAFGAREGARVWW